MKKYYAIFVMFLTLAACKKDGTGIDPDELTGKNWMLSAKTVSPAVDVDGDGDTETDAYASTPACDKDDFVNFSSSTVAIDEGATKCNVSDQQTVTGTWAWNSDNTKLYVTIGSFNDTIDVLTLTSSELKINHVNFINGTTVEATETYHVH